MKTTKYGLLIVALVSSFCWACSDKNTSQCKADTQCKEQPKFDLPEQMIGYDYSMFEPGLSLQLKENINNIFQDSKGRLWFASVTNGVIRYQNDSLTYFSEKDGLGGSAVRTICEDKEGRIWFATSGGLSVFEQGNLHNYKINENAVQNDIRSLLIDKEGLIWVGTNEDLFLFDGFGFERFPLDLKPSEGCAKSCAILCINEDSRGNIWIGSESGAYIYQTRSEQNKLVHLDRNKGLCNNQVNKIIEQDNGNFLFATSAKGVCRLELPSNYEKIDSSNWHFEAFEARNEFKKSAVMDILEDSKGNTWYAVEGESVYQEKNGIQTNVFENQSCLSHGMRCGYEDDQGRLWFGGWLGLYLYQE